MNSSVEKELKNTITFKLLNQTDSVYKSHGITISLDQVIWYGWENYCIKSNIERSNGKTDFDIEHRYDTGECKECGVIGIEHLDSILKFLTKK